MTHLNSTANAATAQDQRQTRINPHKPKAIMCWSGGKDSAMALHEAQNDYTIVALLTTLNTNFKRISMHGVQEKLLDLQAQSIGLPLIKVWVQAGSYEEYEQQMTQGLQRAIDLGTTHVIFGDIFLADLREYRENQLAKVGLQAVFPLWQRPTELLIKSFLSNQFNTITCCINDGYLDATWAGRTIDDSFIKQLPPNVDPCGENGEYHTFCYNGPIFSYPIRFTKGEIIYTPLPKATPTNTKDTTDTYVCNSSVLTNGFWFCELHPC